MAKYASILSLLAIASLIQSFTVNLSGDATSITIENKCGYSVWPAIETTNHAGSNQSSAFSLDKGESKVIIIKSGWTGRIWGRTFCSTDSMTGNFSCQTGDCGTGKIDCLGKSYTLPVTLIEFTTGQSSIPDFYDVSLIDGYNLPVTVSPQGGNGTCAVTGCVFDFKHGCPDELRVMHKSDNSIIGCKSACEVFQTAESCCATIDDCQRNNFSLASLIFKKSCPRAYSYAFDDASSTFSCPGDNSTSYTITFCPPSTLSSLVAEPLQSMQPSPSPSLSILPSPPLITSSPGPITRNTPKNSANSSLKNNEHVGNSKRKRIVLLLSLPTSALVSIFLLYGVWTCMRKRNSIITSTNFKAHEIREAVLDSLEFDLNTLQIATDNFAVENKLGEGGFGEVYKGMLENGQEIAVKRLSKNSRQGIAEFKTEVVLVAKLRHKNLVKLLGYCATLEENILVYEFLPNSSLDRFLFDQKRKASLHWQTRFNIIVGIARGLLYLHEDSPIKVIHRDLKSSNILLDGEMNPKISDFGLAKLFGADESQGDTKRIIGTYGYMAPEYAITGHYSVKSDVYSFGVLILEIVSGQRNRFFGRLQLEEALLHRAWRLWNEEKALDLVDTTLSDKFSRDEVIKCIHIGLSCIQEDATIRPRMTSIVAALNGQGVSLPLPKPPNFFGTTKNFAENEMQQNSPGHIFSGTDIITAVYSRD